MTTQTKNKILTLALTAIAMTSMIACSSQSNNSSTAGLVGSTLYNSSGQSLTSCSHDVAGISDLSMSLEVFSSGGVQDLNHIRVRFNAFPASFVNSASTLVFWAYGTDAYGNYTTMYQVPFTVERYTGSSTFSTISSTPIYGMTWSNLSSLASSNGVSNSSAAVALQSITFVVDLSSVPSSTVLSAAIYSNGVGSSGTYVSPDRYLQTLIPSFLASPADYIATHNNTLLSLHPLYGYINSGYSEAQFATLGQSLCF